MHERNKRFPYETPLTGGPRPPASCKTKEGRPTGLHPTKQSASIR
jgi:hypothetical protein